MFIRKHVSQWIFVSACAIASLPAHAQVVVVGAQSPVPALTANQVSDIFLGKRVALPGGAELVPLDQPEAAPVRQDFYAKVAGRSPALMKSYWSKLLFTGKGQPPRELPGNEAVKKAVASDLRYIGYIERQAVDASVKVVHVTDQH